MNKKPNDTLRPSPFDIVRNLIVEQKWAVDDRNAEALQAFYARDVTLSISVNNGEPIVVRGRDAVMAMTVATWDRSRQTAPHIHFLAAPSLHVVDGDRIAAEYYCLYLTNDPTSPSMVGHGRYRDLFIFEDGAWRILERRLQTTGEVKAGDVKNAASAR
jgi:hypothetical protein